MSAPALRLPRYPNVKECSWTQPGKCRVIGCRYSVVAERPRIEDWEPEDIEELIEALPSTCAITLAATLGPMLIEEIVTCLGVPRPQVEQIEQQGARKLARLRELRRAHWDNY